MSSSHFYKWLFRAENFSWLLKNVQQERTCYLAKKLKLIVYNKRIASRQKFQREMICYLNHAFETSIEFVWNVLDWRLFSSLFLHYFISPFFN